MNSINWLLNYIDIYCERTGPGFLAEPLNLFSNVSFFVAYFITRQRYRISSLPIPLRIAHFFIFAIGVGSATFHATALMWGQLADILPIALFVLVSLYCYLKFIKKFSLIGIVAGYLWLFGVSYLCETFIDPLAVNGSQSYFGVASVLGVLALDQWREKSPQAKYYLQAFLIFVLSLTFRSLDQAFCARFPMGFHFLWHLCNGFLIERIFSGLAERLQNPAAVKSSTQESPAK